MLPFALLDPARYPLALAPSDRTGWFSGTSLVAVDPTSRLTGQSLADAADALERAFLAEEFSVAAVLIDYDGTAEIRSYGGAISHSVSGWSRYGDAPVVPDDPVARSEGSAAHHSTPGPILSHPQIDMTERVWTGQVLAAQEAIARGDVYVVNLTVRVSGTPRFEPAQAFAKLHLAPGGPMAAFFGSPEGSIVSVSPERFLSVAIGHDGASRRAEIWPIKGTAPRGADAAQDAQFVERLRSSEKERAEHVMVVDMERNDLGRVCEPGSIDVDPLLEVFATPYCHQMASCVSGRMRSDAGFAELLEATFPCGSVTGAPKISAMRTIAQLESSPRRAYTGALLVATPGRLDSSVLIRTLEYRADGSAVWGTGCGITIDSDPAAEWEEALLKASPVLG